VAQLPHPPHQLRSDIPEIISQLILRLLAKNPQDRYQSSQGLKVDLEHCLTVCQIEEAVDPFPAGIYNIFRNISASPPLAINEAEVAYINAAMNPTPQGKDKHMSASPQLNSINTKSPFTISGINHTVAYQPIASLDKFLVDLDLETVFKATQLMTTEVDLEPLLINLMQIILKCAGATRGLLLLQHAEQWFVEAEGTVDEVQFLAQTRPFNATLEVPFEIINQVIETKDSVILDEAVTDTQFGQTTYIKLHQSKAILCTPLIAGRELVGLIYLENNLMSHVFTLAILRLITLLGTQAALAITNTKIRAELKQLQIEKDFYEQHAAELTQVNIDKDKFFSVVAHDLKGPFMPLLEYAEYLKEVDESYSVEELRDLGQTIHGTAQNIYTLLENLLQWERLQLGRMKCQPTSILLGTVIQKTMQLLKPTAGKKQITLRDNLTPDLVARADEYMTYTIIRNLTTNALKFTPNKGQVTISTQAIGTTEIEITVADTGVGISPENITKLFKLGTHFTTQGTAQEKGTGLGLIMCREMVELNGGHIWIESERGHGTTVKFTLPQFRN
jgi:signal transduction histidine kinase